MSKSFSLSATVAAASIAFAQSAFAEDIIDEPRVAETVSAYITERCPSTQAEAQNPENIKSCIAAGLDMSNSLATEMTDYIEEVSILTSPFWAGTAKGDLMAYCLSPMESVGRSTFSDLGNYLDAAFNAVKSCEESMARAGEAVDINYQPTARNTVSCHMNRLKGLDCTN